MEDPNHPQKHHHQPTNTNTTFTSLPTELQHNIFSRLPSKPLHICKCVSKEWHSIITSPEFTHYFHTLHSLSSPHSNRHLVLKSTRSLSTFELDNNNNKNNNTQPIISTRSTVTLPESNANATFWLVDTCNGLICVLETDSKKDSFFVYNPFTRLSWTVPSVKLLSFHWWCSFGYDSATDDYKIMRLSLPPGESDTWLETHLFSFKSWSWKKVGDFRYQLSAIPSGCSNFSKFRDGYFHWVVVLDGSNSIGIGRFDVSSEEYSLMELPPVLCKLQGYAEYAELENLEGRLSLQIMRNCGNEKHQFDVWVMKEYGVSD